MSHEIEEVAEIANEIVKEEIHHQFEKPHWSEWIAITTMVMALFSAIGALMAGVTANDLMIERTIEIIELTHMEGDRIDIEVLKSKHEILTALGKPVNHSEIDKIRLFQTDVDRLKLEQNIDEEEVEKTVLEHELFAIGVTLLSIAITLCGMALVTKKKHIWIIGLIFGLIGMGIELWGFYKVFS